MTSTFPRKNALKEKSFRGFWIPIFNGDENSHAKPDKDPGFGNTR